MPLFYFNQMASSVHDDDRAIKVLWDHPTYNFEWFSGMVKEGKRSGYAAQAIDHYITQNSKFYKEYR